MTETQRAAMQQALEALEAVQPSGLSGAYTLAQRINAITALRAALAEPVHYGCHVDLHEGIEPDGCVFDEGRPSLCFYARDLHSEGKGKESCDYWRPIEVKK